MLGFTIPELHDKGKKVQCEDRVKYLRRVFFWSKMISDKKEGDMGRMMISVFIVLVVVVVMAGGAFAEGPGKGQRKGQGKETGSVVSQAVHKAQAEGLKGKDIASAAHKAIEERKAEREKEDLEIKEKMKEKHPKLHKGHKKYMKNKEKKFF